MIDLKPISKKGNNFTKPDAYYLTISPIVSWRDYAYGYYEVKGVGVLTFINKLR